MDALSEVLRALRLTAAPILNADFGAPWAVAAGSSTTLAKGFLPGAESPAVFHLVTSGECWLQVENHEPIGLRAGDAVLLVHGEAHRLGDTPHAQSVALSSLVRPPIAGELVPTVHGGRGARTRIITALAALDRRLADPLLKSLPRVLRANLRGSSAATHLEDAMSLELSESDAPRPGGLASLARLAELAFIDILRREVEATTPGSTGWLAALDDRYVGRALALMHGRPGEGWTVEKLARQVGLSRSALAEHFTALLGQPPIAYLTHWRLCLAAQTLAGTNHSIQTIAKDAGYESAGAFSHAFKRALGKPPTKWRMASRRRKA